MLSIVELYNELIAAGLKWPQLDRYDWIVIGAIIFILGLGIACLLIGHYGPHKELIGIVPVDPNNVWPVNPNQDWTQLDPRWLA